MQEDPRRYNQIDPAIEARVDQLLPTMTLTEKVGQLVQVTPIALPGPDEFARLMQQAQESGQPIELSSRPRPGIEEDIRAGRVGSLLNLFDAQMVNRYQRIAVQQSRLGIPLIVGADGMLIVSAMGKTPARGPAPRWSSCMCAIWLAASPGR